MSPRHPHHSSTLKCIEKLSQWGRSHSCSVTIQWGIKSASVPGALLCSSVERRGDSVSLNTPDSVGFLGCPRVPAVNTMRFLGERKPSWRPGDGGGVRTCLGGVRSPWGPERSHPPRHSSSVAKCLTSGSQKQNLRQGTRARGLLKKCSQDKRGS